MLKILMIFAMSPLMWCASCVHVHTDPIEVKPITLNINLKVDRQLDDFFGPIENKYQASSQPSPATAQ